MREPCYWTDDGSSYVFEYNERKSSAPETREEDKWFHGSHGEPKDFPILDCVEIVRDNINYDRYDHYRYDEMSTSPLMHW